MWSDYITVLALAFEELALVYEGKKDHVFLKGDLYRFIVYKESEDVFEVHFDDGILVLRVIRASRKEGLRNYKNAYTAAFFLLDSFLQKKDFIKEARYWEIRELIYMKLQNLVPKQYKKDFQSIVSKEF